MKPLTTTLFLATASFAGAAGIPTATILSEKDITAGIEFFEKNIRPVLVQKCYGCHSQASGKQKGGLSLDSREGIRLGGESGHAVEPGNPKDSLLLHAIRYEDKEMAMPPQKDGGKLPDAVIANFEQWIRMGAPDPREGAALGKMMPVPKMDWDLAKAKEFWAFRIPKAVPAPSVKNTAWPRSETDKFILGALEGKGIKPVADADKSTLIRRVYFDLIGLPPRPDEVEAFQKDNSPRAFENVVDRLLASRQFGERWGRHWLDVARYAESTGKERNFTFPSAWRYRDYVIDAVNADMPYDQFIREQVAGDLYPHSNDAERNRQLVATGFLALGPKGLNEKNKQQFTMDHVDEQIDVTTRAVLGITVACARCHDHKFDPIPQREYYAMAGIFRSTDTYYGTGGGKNRNGSLLLPLAGGPSPTPAMTSATSPAAAPRASTAAPVAAQATGVSGDQAIEERLRQIAAKNPNVAARLASMTPLQKERLLERFGRNSAAQPTTDTGSQAAKPAQAASAFAARNGNKKNKKKKGGYAAAPVAIPGQELCMGVLEGRPTDTRVLIRGEIDQPAETVPRGFVTVMTNGEAPAIPSTASGRKELAEWLTAPGNPLTARVQVNRVWQHLFGNGLVPTADNFGATGEAPTHPDLLDTLAVQFMKDGWSVKKLIRSLVLSRTYQLSNGHDSFANEVDPGNRLLWRAAQRRLDAEAIRDAMLAASGQLDATPPKGSLVSAIGDGYIGRGIKPDVFANYESQTRSIYMPVVRDFVPEVLEIFDFAEPSLVVASRDVTNVPSQALFMMNDTFVRTQAAAMAKRILAMPMDYSKRLDTAYQLALARTPTEAERQRADAYLKDEARALIPEKGGNKEEAALLSWSTFCQALFACAEFRYIR